MCNAILRRRAPERSQATGTWKPENDRLLVAANGSQFICRECCDPRSETEVLGNEGAVPKRGIKSGT